MPDSPIPNLLVLRVRDIDRAAEFYRKIGLELVIERHGKGPEHYASEIEGFVFEIYPQTDHSQPTTGVRIGFQVHSIDKVVADLAEAGAEVVTAPHDSPWGRRAVVKDTDGHMVELTERS